MSTRAYDKVLRSLAIVGALTGFGCAGVKPIKSGSSGGSTGFGSGGSSSGNGGSTGAGGTITVTPTGCNGQCTDFEPTNDNPNPIYQEGVSSDASGKFGSGSGSGPCVTEPEEGSLFPNNWLPPRVHVPGNTGLMKITFHADMESTDLVAYAQGDSWALPKPVWQNLAAHIVEQPVTVTVQTPNSGTTTVTFQIAAVGAGGSMVFWSADPNAVGKDLSTITDLTTIKNDSYLDGFTVGDTSTIATANGAPVLSITDVKQPTVDNSGATRPGPRCIGCHAGTPDGSYVAFNDFWPWSLAFANISGTGGVTAGSTLPNYGGATCTNWNTCTPTCAQGSTCDGGKIYAQEPWGGPAAFSPAFWDLTGSGSGARIALMVTQLMDPSNPWSQDNKSPGKLIWMDTNSTAYTMINGVPVPQQGVAWDLIAHAGDLGGVAFPTWSNDGNHIVYASSAGSTADQDGRLNLGKTDLYQVPYNNKAGGAATPVPGASSASMEEYYPAFAPDDSMIAYTAVPSGQVMYANEQAELYVVPYGNSDAQAVRLNANDPPKCSGLQSPGINNHWPKWSPTVGSANGKTYYWLIFSSNRYNPAPKSVTNSGTTTTVYVSQLYITAIVKSEVGFATYPAIYLYNQPATRLNTTPAWQDFHIPIIVN